MLKNTLSIIFLLCAFTGNAKQYVITNYGVKTDSTVNNTKAIQQVIDIVAKNGGDTIVIPEGTYLSGALFFKPNTHLKLLKGAVLKGSDNIADYPLVPSRMEGRVLDYYAALVNAYQADNFSISGEGTINGNGLRYWKQFWAYRDSLKSIGKVATNLEVHRPRLIFIKESNHVKIQNTNLCNSGFWTTHLYKCNDILIENCRITSPKKPIAAPSTDGIDLDVCSKVVIRNCYISVNDDAICIKGGKGVNAHKMPENGVVEDVLVENCTAEYPSPGILTLGSECVHARNITVRNCKVINCSEILLLKMRPDTYQTYENITVDGVTGTCQYILKMAPWKQFFDLQGSTEEPFGTVGNIAISNVDITCKTLLDMAGNKNDKVSGIRLKNIKATAQSEEFTNKYSDITYENVVVNGKLINAN